MQSIWAPWRLEYILANQSPSDGCFFCRAWQSQGQDNEHLLLARGQRAFVMMNRFPYNNAHLMVAPVEHVGGVEAVDSDGAAEIWSLVSTCKSVLEDVANIDGCNIGINQGKVAGAGVLDHLHVHVVPRWDGDTNFMPVIADVKVMPQALEDCYDQLRPAFAARGF